MISSYFKTFLIIVISLLIFSACSSSKKLGSSKNIDQNNIDENSSGGESVNPREKQSKGVKYNSTRSNMESDKDPENNNDKDDKKDDK